MISTWENQATRRRCNISPQWQHKQQILSRVKQTAANGISNCRLCKVLAYQKSPKLASLGNCLEIGAKWVRKIVNWWGFDAEINGKLIRA